MKKFIGNKTFYKSVLVIMLPILLQNVITNFVNLLDNLMVGQIGTEQMSGVAIVNQLIFVFNLAIFGGLSGAGIFTAQFYGKGDSKGVRYSMRLKLYFGLIIAVIFLLVLSLFGDPLIRLFVHQGSEELDMERTLDYGRAYLKVIMIQLLPFMLSQVYGSTLRETGETLVPMKAGIAAVIVNITFNYILIFGKLGAPALGVVGAALATVLSRFVELAIVAIWTHRHKQRNEFIVGLYKSAKIPNELLKSILRTGAPLLFNELMWGSGMAILNQCYSVRGLDVVSAVNISNTVSNLFWCAMFAMGSTVSIMIGQLLGAGQIERAVDEDRKIIAFGVVMCAFIGAIMGFLAPLFPKAYNTTETVKQIATQLLIVNACIMPVSSFVHSCYFTLRSGGKTLITLLFDSVFQWTLCVPLAFVLSRYTAMPIVRMFICVTALDILKCIIGYVLVKKRKWVKNLVEG